VTRNTKVENFRVCLPISLKNCHIQVILYVANLAEKLQQIF